MSYSTSVPSHYEPGSKFQRTLSRYKTLPFLNSNPPTAMMKLMNVFLTVLLATTALASAEYLDDYNKEEMQDTEATVSEMHEKSTSLRGVSRILSQQNALAASVTCDKLPRVCHLKNSPGKDCCNVKTDRLNCGMCGYKCKYTETCCRGKCGNAMFDKRHCGGCNQKCKKGEFSVYGMCNYA